MSELDFETLSIGSAWVADALVLHKDFVVDEPSGFALEEGENSMQHLWVVPEPDSLMDEVAVSRHQLRDWQQLAQGYSG